MTTHVLDTTDALEDAPDESVDDFAEPSQTGEEEAGGATGDTETNAGKKRKAPGTRDPEEGDGDTDESVPRAGGVSTRSKGGSVHLQPKEDEGALTLFRNSDTSGVQKRKGKGRAKKKKTDSKSEVSAGSTTSARRALIGPSPLPSSDTGTSPSTPTTLPTASRERGVTAQGGGAPTITVGSSTGSANAPAPTPAGEEANVTPRQGLTQAQELVLRELLAIQASKGGAFASFGGASDAAQEGEEGKGEVKEREEKDHVPFDPEALRFDEDLNNWGGPSESVQLDLSSLSFGYGGPTGVGSDFHPSTAIDSQGDAPFFLHSRRLKRGTDFKGSLNVVGFTATDTVQYTCVFAGRSRTTQEDGLKEVRDTCRKLQPGTNTVDVTQAMLEILRFSAVKPTGPLQPIGLSAGPCYTHLGAVNGVEGMHPRLTQCTPHLHGTDMPILVLPGRPDFCRCDKELSFPAGDLIKGCVNRNVLLPPGANTCIPPAGYKNCVPYNAANDNTNQRFVYFSWRACTQAELRALAELIARGKIHLMVLLSADQGRVADFLRKNFPLNVVFLSTILYTKPKESLVLARIATPKVAKELHASMSRAHQQMTLVRDASGRRKLQGDFNTKAYIAGALALVPRTSSNTNDMVVDDFADIL
jgi:hypothetical protein